MMLPTTPAAPAEQTQRFELEIWPETVSRPWRAELSDAGAGDPIRFEQPMELLLYLTRPRGTRSPPPRGLR